MWWPGIRAILSIIGIRFLKIALLNPDSKSHAADGASSTAFCPFCDIAENDTEERIQDSNEFAYMIGDGFPVTRGHTLIIPKRHIASFFEATDKERQALLKLVDQAKEAIDIEHKPAAYNIGINDGPAAGQTIPHLHLHLIPRYEDQTADPRGGVRWVIPEKAAYWVND